MLPIPQNLGDLIGIVQFIQLLQGFGDAFMIIVSTPDNFTFTLPGVHELWLFMSVVANALVVTFLITGATQMMISRNMGRDAVTPQELVTRFGTQLIAINASFFLTHTLVNLENGLCAGVLNFTVAQVANNIAANGNNVLLTIVSFILSSIPITSLPDLILGTPLIMLGIIILAFIVVLILVFFQAVMRLVRLNLFLILTPLAFLFLTLDQTREYGSFILRLLVINIFVQFLQVLAFCLVLLLLASVFVGGPYDSPVMKLALTIGQMLGVYSIPGLLSQFGIEGGSWNSVFNTVKMGIRVAAMAAGVPPVI